VTFDESLSLTSGTIVRIHPRDQRGSSQIAVSIYRLSSYDEEERPLQFVHNALYGDIIMIIKRLDTTYMSHNRLISYSVLHESGIIGSCVLNTSDVILTRS